jgi:hypothetical protein
MAQSLSCVKLTRKMFNLHYLIRESIFGVPFFYMLKLPYLGCDERISVSDNTSFGTP